ncbi:oxidoreductase [Basidiobolus meristosporus CBS 931.73]|uniref:Oxidoreductase n=1 Tax=Basidiobolus meristosporus CBS 931.73 TaxID=1314790 RepID=A0A1Y1YXH1_9FUNG|nr:oxidoreductase [Basidiobolus meristosporus CBS 931.73]|eukprot:ORY02710.1 oxidoreductase [Basidiobolus meristosporus CBS 931.73]
MSNTANQKIVFVTGCSKGGIGYELCQEFARRKCKVIASARKVEAMEGLEEFGIERVRMDVVDEASVKEAIENVISRFGRIDILVNNAGVGGYGPLIEFDIEQVKSVYETNVFGVIRLCQIVAPHMIKNGHGQIVNVGSVVGYHATPWAGVYCSTKAALHSLSDSLRLELKPFGIDVTVVTPGAIKSNISHNHSLKQTSQLSEDSYYTSVRKYIEARQNLSQAGATSTEEFARATVEAILRPNPPSYFAYGTNVALMSILNWLPVWVKDLIFTRKFGTDKVKLVKAD